MHLVHDKVTGKPRGYAFIEYEHEKDMHGKLMEEMVFVSRERTKVVVIMVRAMVMVYEPILHRRYISMSVGITRADRYILFSLILAIHHFSLSTRSDPSRCPIIGLQTLHSLSPFATYQPVSPLARNLLSVYVSIG